MKTIRCIFAIITVLLLGVLIASAQTDIIAATNAIASPPSASAATTATDIAKVLQDFGIHVNITSLGSLLFLVYYIAKWIRNKTAIGQTGFGRILAGILNAEATPPKPPAGGSAIVGIILALCLFATAGQAQQFQPPAISLTNWTVLGGYGQSFNHEKQIVFGDVAYNFNKNVGIVLGADQLWAPGQRQANIVKGGVTLSATIHPFAFIGSTPLTNVIGSPFISDLLATPKGGHSSIGNITTTGFNFDILAMKNLELGAGFQIEKRIGQGFWDDKYWLAHLEITRKF